MIESMGIVYLAVGNFEDLDFQQMASRKGQ
jgi:hypothetical protein